MPVLKKLAILSVPIAVGIYFLRDYSQGCLYEGKETLHGINVIVTGANSGIGKETVINLASRGAKVIMACRSLERAETAKQDILKNPSIKSEQIIVKKLDLSSFKSIRNFVDDYEKTENKLNILINNAGVMWTPFTKTKDGIEHQVGVNHFGHFLLTNLLLDMLKESAPSRIVTVSSRAHIRGKLDLDNFNKKENYSWYGAYSNSKLMNIMFTRELAKRLKGTGVTTYSLHPGVIMTELQKELLPTDGWLFSIAKILLYPLAKTTERGAQTTIYCAVNEGAGSESGLYYSDCATKEPIPEAVDDEKCQKLWQLSEKLTGLK